MSTVMVSGLNYWTRLLLSFSSPALGHNLVRKYLKLLAYLDSTRQVQVLGVFYLQLHVVVASYF